MYLEIHSNPSDVSPFEGLSLAEAFKKRIGRLPSKEERMATSGLKTPGLSSEKPTPKAKSKNWNKENKLVNRPNTLKLDAQSVVKNENCFITPKSREPSEELLNRLVGGSKVKVSKK